MPLNELNIRTLSPDFIGIFSRNSLDLKFPSIKEIFMFLLGLISSIRLDESVSSFTKQILEPSSMYLIKWLHITLSFDKSPSLCPKIKIFSIFL